MADAPISQRGGAGHKIVLKTVLKTATVKPIGLSGNMAMKGTEAKESTWKKSTEEITPRSLKSIPGSSTMSSDKRSQMIQKIKGQASISQLKDQLLAAESKVS